MKTFTDASFQAEVLDNAQLTIVDFWAAWCGPCRTLAPIMERVAKRYVGRVTIGKLDIEAETKTTDSYEIKSIPTLVFFQKGKEVERIVGLRSESELEAIIDKHLAA